MNRTHRYDAVVIGAGQGGIPLAMALARAGRTNALIEREHVGGTCINEGCTPTKTMVASARVAYLARRAADYGVQASPVAVDMAAVRQRKRAIVQSFRSGGERCIAKTEGLDLLRGEACFTSPTSLEVRGEDGTPHHITAQTIVINTGARPSMPPLEGIEAVPVFDSTSIMELDEVPPHLLVLGGGYVGLEFGQMFRRFGSAVTIVQRGAQLLAREDKDVADAVAAIVREDGVEILRETAAQRVERTAGGAIALSVRTPEGERTLEGSHLLVAAGRSPNTETLNLKAAGVQTDKRSFVRVNERLETNVPGIYGLGDALKHPRFWMSRLANGRPCSASI
jgi:pyruvate/2-oxoglutarate dehydrogenase complex dihydrolipoamide dehydrogenase (E3) component